MKASTIALALLALTASSPAVRGQVGYANVVITNGFNFLGNPFNASDTNGVQNNSITNVLASGTPAIPSGAAVYLWNTASQSFGTPAVYSPSTGWSASYDLSPGKGFALYSPSSWTLTFLGTVLQGYQTNVIAGTNKFSLVASKLPLPGDLSAAGLGLPTTDGENLYLYSTNTQSFLDAFTWFAGYGWFDPDGVAGSNGPVVAVAQAFFVQHPGPDLNWVQLYTGPVAPPPGISSLSATAPALTGITLNGGRLTLWVQNAGGASYNIEFSADGKSWATIATGQTATSWIGRPSGAHGYYRLNTP